MATRPLRAVRSAPSCRYDPVTAAGRGGPSGGAVPGMRADPKRVATTSRIPARRLLLRRAPSGSGER